MGKASEQQMLPKACAEHGSGCFCLVVFYVFLLEGPHLASCGLHRVAKGEIVTKDSELNFPFHVQLALETASGELKIRSGGVLISPL